jgi:hypothetical protein
MINPTSPRFRNVAPAAALALLLSAAATAQTPAPPATPESAAQPSPDRPPGAEAEGDRGAGAADGGALAPLAWLEGCWQGTVNQREFREHWLPLRGGMLIGAGQQVSRGRMQDYEFMRLEARTDGIYFSQFSGERREISFKLASTTTENKDTIFTFTNTVDAFPERLVYRRGVDGWLYETIEGKLAGSDKKVIYPLRRVGCESGELILR